jgi:hypothetical protein
MLLIRESGFCYMDVQEMHAVKERVIPHASSSGVAAGSNLAAG